MQQHKIMHENTNIEKHFGLAICDRVSDAVSSYTKRSEVNATCIVQKNPQTHMHALIHHAIPLYAFRKWYCTACIHLFTSKYIFNEQLGVRQKERERNGTESSWKQRHSDLTYSCTFDLCYMQRQSPFVTTILFFSIHSKRNRATQYNITCLRKSFQIFNLRLADGSAADMTMTMQYFHEENLKKHFA